MIIKDGSATIERCLRSARPWVREMVVADTGSRDGSVELARSLGARVIHVPWGDDFAEARNRSLDACTSRWVLVLDADESLGPDPSPTAGDTWGRALADDSAAGYELLLRNVDAAGEPTSSLRLLRLFRNAPEVRFRYPIHEQIIPSLAQWARPRGMKISRLPVEIIHTGYGAVDPAKLERNLRILEKAAEDSPDDPFIRYNLGKTLSHPGIGRMEESVACLLLARETLAIDCKSRLEAGFGPDLYHFLAKGLRETGRRVEGLEMLGEAIHFWPRHPELRYDRGELLLASGRHLEAAEAFAGCLECGEAPDNVISEPGAGSFLALDGLGRALAHMGRWEDAISFFREAIRAEPRSHSSRYNLAEVFKSLGRFAEAVDIYMEILLDAPGETAAWAQGAQLLERMGIAGDAMRWRQQAGVVLHAGG